MRRIRQVITRLGNGISYEVWVDEISGDDASKVGNATKCVWHQFVAFGRNKASRAGGPAFQQAAREQERIAKTYA